MAERSIVTRLRLEIGDLVRNAKTAGQAMQDMASKSNAQTAKTKDAISTLSNGAGIAGAALTGLATLAVSKAASFDASMSSVQAATMETADNMLSLRDAALDAGARTVYSATESAGAIEELAKAGVSTADILSGGLDGALDLAASGAIAVGDAAEIAATAMTQFGLGGRDVTHISDLLAAGAGKAQGGVGDLGMALKQAGLVANQTGLSIDETTAGLAAFASAGLIGSDAGTSFKSMLQRLTPQSQEAQDEMDRLGISAYDAQGNFIGLANFAGNLQGALRDLTPEQRNSTLATIFGSDAVRAATALYDQGAAGIREWISAVDDQGYAARQASIRMDNLKGDVEGLSGSFETALIGMGEGAQGPLRSIVQQVDGVVDTFNRLPDSAKSATLAIVGGGGLVLLGVAGLGKLTIGASNALGAMRNLGLVSEATSAKIAGFAGSAGKAVGKLGLIIAAIEALNVANTRASDSTEHILSTIDQLGSSGDVVKDIFGDMVPKDSDLRRGEDFGAFLNEMANPGTWRTIYAGATDMGVAITRVFGDKSVKWSELKAQIDAYGDALGDLASSDMPAVVDAFTALYDEAGGTEKVGQDLLKTMPGLRDALVGVASGAGFATDDASLLNIALGKVDPTAVASEDSIRAFADALSGANVEAGNQVELLDDLIKRQNDLAGVALSVRDAQRDLEQSISDASDSLKENGATLDITTQKGRDNQAALDGIASSGWDLITSMRENGASQEDLQSTMQSTRDRFIEVAQQFGLTKDQATSLADELHLIPTDVTVSTAFDDAETQRKIQALKDAVNTIPTGIVSIQTVGFSDTYNYLKQTQDAINSINGTRVRVAMGAGGGGGLTFGDGGYTGSGNPLDPAGVVHRDEQVIKASSRRSIESARPGLLDAMNVYGAAALGGYADGGRVGYSARYAMPVWSSPSVAAPAGARTEVHAPIYVSSSDPVSAGIEGARYVQRLVT